MNTINRSFNNESAGEGNVSEQDEEQNTSRYALIIKIIDSQYILLYAHFKYSVTFRFLEV